MSKPKTSGHLVFTVRTSLASLCICATPIGWSQTEPQLKRAPVDAATVLAAEVNAPFPANLRVQDRATGASVECAQAEAGLSRDARKSKTANERLASAIAVRSCVEAQRAESVARLALDPRAAIAGSPALTMSLSTAAWAPKLAAAEADVKEFDGQANFMGMSFGVGIGFSQSRKERVTEASVAADGTLRVTAREKQVPRVILEAHYYGVCEKTLQICNESRYGVGPFFGLAATGDAIEAFALGVMFGRKDPTLGANGGFSLGVGAVLDKKVKDLAPGFVEGKPLPTGETAPAFSTRSKWSPLLFFTRTF